MAIFFDAPVEPDDLTTFIREVPTNVGRPLLSLFPRREVQDNKVNYAEITHTNRVARFRTWDGRVHVSSRDTASEKVVGLPPLSTSLSTGELERLQLEFARNGGTRTAALSNAIYNDAQNLTNEVLNRMELAIGQVLTSFKFTLGSIAEEPALEADFGVPSGHSVSASTVWTTVATATALDELIAWHDTYVATNGQPAGQIRTSLRVLRLLTRNAQIINSIKGAAATVSRVTIPELNDLLESVGVPRLGAALDTALSVDGVTTRPIADDKLLFLPDDANMGELGAVYWGVTATALELVNSNESDLSFEEAPGIVGVVEKIGPPYREFVYVDACAMPVLINPNRLLVADVA